MTEQQQTQNNTPQEDFFAKLAADAEFACQEDEQYFNELVARAKLDPNAPEVAKENRHQIKDSYREREQQERARENALPFAERTAWRTRRLYRGWMLEPIIKSHESVAGSSPFAITRSNYGYRVLNSPDLGIIDVDFNLCYGISKRHVPAQQNEAIANLRAWVDSHQEQSWRVYRTAAGLRLIRTDAPQQLDGSYDEVSNAIADADDLYRHLCKEQNAFRARISAKSSRCGVDYPHWCPYDRGGDGWEGCPPTEANILAYETAAQNHKVAELIEVVGTGAVDPRLVFVLTFHDDSCRLNSVLPLEQPTDADYVLVSDIAELIAFNDVYRPQGMAPDQVWDSLDADMRSNLKLINRTSAIAACKRLDWCYRKWEYAVGYQDFDSYYLAAYKRYKEDAKRFTWVSTGEVTHDGLVKGHWQSSEEYLATDDLATQDSRYWQLDSPTSEATTSAVIRFLPAPDNQRYAKIQDGGIITHYVSNIIVINDPSHPANNGKVFLYKFGYKIKTKIKDLTDPPPEFPDIMPIDPWDPAKGANFKVRAFLLDRVINLDKCTFETSASVGDDALIADLLTRVYSLTEA